MTSVFQQHEPLIETLVDNGSRANSFNYDRLAPEPEKLEQARRQFVDAWNRLEPLRIDSDVVDYPAELLRATTLEIAAKGQKLASAIRGIPRTGLDQSDAELTGEYLRFVVQVVEDAAALAGQLDKSIASESVPGSDRLVSIDHNSSGYADVADRLDELQRGIQASNEVEGEVRDRARAEVQALAALLKAKTVSAHSLEFIRRLLRWLAEKFADTVVGMVITALIASICLLLGIQLPL